jgi:hypothetical protein
LYIIVIVLEKGNMVNTLLLFFHRVLDVYDYSVYMFKERIIIRVLVYVTLLISVPRYMLV